MAVDLSGWEITRGYAIDPADVDAALSNFPACIIITHEDLQLAQDDGADVRVTDADETQFLDHEIQTIETAAGSERLVLWLKIPSVSASAKTEIRVHWGNDSAPDTQAPASLWTDYEAVYHMNGGFEDSAGNHGGTEKTHDGSTPGFSNVAGVIEEGMYSPGDPNYVDAGPIDGGWESLIEDDHSLQLWAKPDDGQPDTRQAFFGHIFEVPTEDAYIWVLGIREDDFAGRAGRTFWRNELNPEVDLKAVDESGDVTGEEDFFGDGAQPWTMIQFNLDFGDAGTSIYKNGEPRPVDNRADDIAGITPPTGWVGDGSNPLVLFAHWETEPAPKVFNFFTGAIDELRVRDGLISDAWARTEYENQNDATVGGFWQLISPDQPVLTVDAARTTEADLSSSAYNSPVSAAHDASRWQVDVAGGDFSSPLYDSLWTQTDLESHTARFLPSGRDLEARVAHRDEEGLYVWSDPVAFSTTDIEDAVGPRGFFYGAAGGPGLLKFGLGNRDAIGA